MNKLHVQIPNLTPRSASHFSTNDPCSDFSSKFLVCIAENTQKESCKDFQSQYYHCLIHFKEFKYEERKRRYFNYHSTGFSTRTWR